ENRTSAGGQVGALGCREVNQQDIAGVTFIYHWKDRWITHEAAIPIVLRANLWCACPEWHAIRSDDMLVDFQRVRQQTVRENCTPGFASSTSSSRSRAAFFALSASFYFPSA